MSATPPEIYDLAGRLMSLEADRADPSIGRRAGQLAAVVRTCDKLRSPLVKLAGIAGFSSLLSRALSLARAEVPSLAAWQLTAEGSLTPPDGADETYASETGAIILAKLIELLVIFIGKPLTLRLVLDAWPDASSIGIEAGNGEES